MFTVIPVPAPTVSVAAPDVAPPVKPLPATTDVMSPVVGVAHAGLAPVPPVVRTSPDVPKPNLAGAPEAP